MRYENRTSEKDICKLINIYYSFCWESQKKFKPNSIYSQNSGFQRERKPIVTYYWPHNLGISSQSKKKFFHFSIIPKLLILS